MFQNFKTNIDLIDKKQIFISQKNVNSIIINYVKMLLVNNL